jgi:Pvc16 N-terminal domain
LARGDRADPQLNLFLYQVSPDASWRNQNVPGQPASTYPLLALRLYYLVTAFGQDDDDRQAHDLLGAVMHRFHTDPIPLRSGAGQVINASGIAEQFEPIRISLQPLTLDDLSKIWAGSPSPYRLSVGYEVSVVLIDSGKPTRSAPPVLGRADRADGGFEASATNVEPAIEGLRFPIGLPGPRLTAKGPPFPIWLSDELTVAGQNLDHADLRLVFRHLRLGFGYIAKLERFAEKPTLLRFRLPHDLTVFREDPGKALDSIEKDDHVVADNPQEWPVGVYTVAAARAVRVKREIRQADGSIVVIEVLDRLYTTAPVAFGLLPQIDTTAGPLRLFLASGTLRVRLLNPLRRTATGTLAQAVKLFAGSLELLGTVTPFDDRTLDWEAADVARLKTDLDAAKARDETLYLRVQVDGVDSSLLEPPPAGEASPLRKFDANLVVTVA